MKDQEQQPAPSGAGDVSSYRPRETYEDKPLVHWLVPAGAACGERTGTVVCGLAADSVTCPKCVEFAAREHAEIERSRAQYGSGDEILGNIHRVAEQISTPPPQPMLAELFVEAKARGEEGPKPTRTTPFSSIVDGVPCHVTQYDFADGSHYREAGEFMTGFTPDGARGDQQVPESFGRGVLTDGRSPQQLRDDIAMQVFTRRLNTPSW